MHNIRSAISWLIIASAMGNTQSASPNSLVGCLQSTIPSSLVSSPSDLLYYIKDVTPYNTNIKVSPVAVVVPQTVVHVQSAVKCAGKYGAKVQAKSGGHSYGNYGNFNQSDWNRMTDSRQHGVVVMVILWLWTSRTWSPSHGMPPTAALLM
jgi:hypothetical protein